MTSSNPTGNGFTRWLRTPGAIIIGLVVLTTVAVMIKIYAPANVGRLMLIIPLALLGVIIVLLLSVRIFDWMKESPAKIAEEQRWEEYTEHTAKITTQAKPPFTEEWLRDN